MSRPPRRRPPGQWARGPRPRRPRTRGVVRRPTGSRTRRVPCAPSSAGGGRTALVDPDEIAARGRPDRRRRLRRGRDRRTFTTASTTSRARPGAPRLGHAAPGATAWRPRWTRPPGAAMTHRPDARPGLAGRRPRRHARQHGRRVKELAYGSPAWPRARPITGPVPAPVHAPDVGRHAETLVGVQAAQRDHRRLHRARRRARPRPAVRTSARSSPTAPLTWTAPDGRRLGRHLLLASAAPARQPERRPAHHARRRTSSTTSARAGTRAVIDYWDEPSSPRSSAGC